MGAQGIKKLFFLFGILFAYSLETKADHLIDCSEPLPISSGLFEDFILFNKNLVSKNTLKVIAAFAPIYGVTRAFDHRVHANFYCARHHKNKRQLPTCAYNITHYGIGVIMVGLASLGLFARDDLLRRTAQLYAITLPYTWIIKDLLKKIKVDACLRPKNQKFSRHKKYYGGCPSGHMMEMTYTAMLFGTQMGPAFGVPLGIFAGAIAIDFINCNRHLLSQVVAGAGLGVIFAVAANKVLSSTDRIAWSIRRDRDCMAVRAEYNF